MEASGNESEGDVQVVSLKLGGQLYGIDIAKVHTVITPQAITAVPRAAYFIRGVINLRGRVIPVLDLRLRFGLPAREASEESRSRIVIIDCDGLTAGLVFDGASEVMRIPRQCIDPPSELVTTPESECVTGIGRIPKSASAAAGASGGIDAERLILLLDVRKILGPAMLQSGSGRKAA